MDDVVTQDIQFSTEVINECSTSWSLISTDSYIVEIRIAHDLIQVTNTSQQSEELDNSLPNTARTIPLLITNVQASSSIELATLVRQNMLEYVGEYCIDGTCSFLRWFISAYPPGSSTIAVIRVLKINYVHGEEEYLAEFRARLVGAEKIYDMELVKYKSGVLSDGACAICHEGFEEDMEVVKTDCLHIFHHKCIGVWMIRKFTCPMCRQKIR